MGVDSVQKSHKGSGLRMALCQHVLQTQAGERERDTSHKETKRKQSLKKRFCAVELKFILPCIANNEFSEIFRFILPANFLQCV